MLRRSKGTGTKWLRRTATAAVAIVVLVLGVGLLLPSGFMWNQRALAEKN